MHAERWPSVTLFSMALQPERVFLIQLVLQSFSIKAQYNILAVGYKNSKCKDKDRGSVKETSTYNVLMLPALYDI